jgi:hypothetical protein
MCDAATKPTERRTAEAISRSRELHFSKVRRRMRRRDRRDSHMANRERHSREFEYSQGGRRREHEGERHGGRREGEYGREGDWGAEGPEARQGGGREWSERQGFREPYEDFSERGGYSGYPSEYGGQRGGWGRQQGGGYGQRGGSREQENWGGPWGQEDFGQTGSYGYNRGERRWSGPESGRSGGQEYGRGGQERFGRGPEYPGEWWGGPGRQGGYGESGFEGGYGHSGYGRSGSYGQAGYGQGWSGQGRFPQRSFQEDFGQGREYGEGMYGGQGRFYGGQEMYGGRGQGRQSFAGRGPKGYQRSDERIKEDISEQLTQHPEIDATEIEVRVQGGEVTLTGTADSRHAKRLAEDIAESASGVKECHNQIRVKQQESESGHATSHGRSSESSSKSR